MEEVKTFPLIIVPAAAKSLQSCPTLCDPIDGSPPGSPVPGILQARTLEWVAISFSGEWKWKVKVKSLSRVRLLATPWTAAYQAFPSMGFSMYLVRHLKKFFLNVHILLLWVGWDLSSQEKNAPTGNTHSHGSIKLEAGILPLTQPLGASLVIDPTARARVSIPT